MQPSAINMDWMTEEIVGVKGVRHVVVLSADGFLRAQSPGTPRAVAETLAAAFSGLHALLDGVNRAVGSGKGLSEQLFNRGTEENLFLQAAGDRSMLGVIAEPEADPGLIAQAMKEQVLKIGERTLSTPARANEGP